MTRSRWLCVAGLLVVAAACSDKRALGGGAAAGQPTTGTASGIKLDQLLTSADVERVGSWRPIVRDPRYESGTGRDIMYVRESDSAMVVTIRYEPAITTAQNFGGMRQLYGKDAVAATGIGDEAFFVPGLFSLMFRKGSHSFQLLWGVDPMSTGRLVTEDQLRELANLIASRL